MSVMGFQKKSLDGGGWGELYPIFFGFLEFFYFGKPLRYLVHSEQLLNGMKYTLIVLLVSLFGVSETVNSFLWLIHGCLKSVS